MTRRRIFGATVFLIASIGIYLMFRLFGAPIPASAHGAFTERIHAKNYDIEVGRDSETIALGNFERFNLNLIGTSTEEKDVPFTSVWIRLEHGDDVLMATWLYKPDGLLPGFSYHYEAPGDYILRMRFVDGTTSLAEEEYPFTVTGDDFSESTLITLLIGMVIGGAVIAFLGRRHVLGM